MEKSTFVTCHRLTHFDIVTI